MSSQLNRADLLRIRARSDSETLDAAAGLMGLHIHRQRQPAQDQQSQAAGLAVEHGLDQADSDAPWADTPFWAVVEQRSFSPAPQPEPTVADQVISAPEWQYPVEPPAATVFICPRQLASVRAQLWQLLQGRQADLPALVQRVSQLKSPLPLPRRGQRQIKRVRVLVDRATRLVPWWSWQTAWYRALTEIGLEIELAVATQGQPPLLIDRRGKRSRWRPPAEGTPVLLLGDAGAQGSTAERLRWANLARQLRSRRCRALLLAPAGSGGIGWHKLLPRPATAISTDPETLQRLLVLCSFVSRLEPGLALDLCAVLGAPAALAAQLWQHPAIASPSCIAASFHPGTREQHRIALAALCTEQPELLRATLATVRSWRADFSPELWYGEILALPIEAQSLLPAPEELQQARHWFQRLDKHGAGSEGGAARALLQREFARGINFEAQPEHTRQQLSRLLRHSCGDSLPTPEGFEPGAIAPPPQASEQRLQLALRSGPQGLVIDPGGVGSPLAELRSINGELQLGGRSRQLAAIAGQGIALPNEQQIVLRSDVESLRLQRLYKPGWASAMGRDSHGLWCEISVNSEHVEKPVGQRLRYCPPGNFWMGSSEEEQGRWLHEGPQHRVHLSQGYWMFDTPARQLLWRAVMGGNPSKIEGNDRPVESVSYEDVGRFLLAINTRCEGIELALPSEAQWEYACRAGSETPRYGELDIIAWHDENSQLKTHPVGQKLANDWGLYDTLGNVWEWCSDGLRDYQKRSVNDPLGSTIGDRAVRGGAWDFGARRMRATCRSASATHEADFGLGFRCLRVQSA